MKSLIIYNTLARTTNTATRSATTTTTTSGNNNNYSSSYDNDDIFLWNDELAAEFAATQKRKKRIEK